MSTIIYKIIEIFQNIVIIIILFYVILYGNSATNLNTESCMTHMTLHVQFTKCQTIMPTYHVTCGKVN